jgi:hypothetical protein
MTVAPGQSLSGQWSGGGVSQVTPAIRTGGAVAARSAYAMTMTDRTINPGAIRLGFMRLIIGQVQYGATSKAKNG